jgi:hypothetical protein
MLEERIKKWDVRNVYELVRELEDNWTYKDHVKKSWERNCLILELHTGGDSYNESLINALEQNTIFWAMYWDRIIRGGHYYFKIDFSLIGFKLVSEVAKERGFSRQNIFQSKEKYEWIVISEKKRLIRPL